MKKNGILFHAKHAFMPNRLGYCGPDENGTIRQVLEEGKSGEELVRTLQGFEAAYPFLKLIARSNGRKVFDYAVPEAYWIGNGLLERVPGSEFYSFSHHEIKGRDPRKVKEAFKVLDGDAPPHHSFYVMSTYATTIVPDGPNLTNESRKKVGELVDNCRISWGRVKGVEKGMLQVEVRPVTIEDGRLSLAPPKVKRVQYNPEVSPFSSVRPGDAVSLHWNYACDILTSRQARNIAKYTSADLALVNRILSSKRGRRGSS
jgi:hypothetical protein